MGQPTTRSSRWACAAATSSRSDAPAAPFSARASRSAVLVAAAPSTGGSGDAAAVCVPAGIACAAPPPTTPITRASADRAWRARSTAAASPDATAPHCRSGQPTCRWRRPPEIWRPAGRARRPAASRRRPGRRAACRATAARRTAAPHPRSPHPRDQQQQPASAPCPHAGADNANPVPRNSAAFAARVPGTVNGLRHPLWDLRLRSEERRGRVLTDVQIVTSSRTTKAPSLSTASRPAW